MFETTYTCERCKSKNTRIIDTKTVGYRYSEKVKCNNCGLESQWFHYYDGPVIEECSRCHKNMGTHSSKRVEVPEMLKITLDGNGYFHHYVGHCSACREELHRIKVKRRIRLTVTVVIIALVIVAALLANSFLTGGGTHGFVYNQLLKRCEENPAITAVDSARVGSKTLALMRGELAKGDYTLYLFGEGDATVQKNTLNGKTSYYWVFGKGYGDLSKKTFILQDGIIYEQGDENIAYYKSSSEYAPLLKKLQDYQPEKYCGKGKYTSEKSLNDTDEQITAGIIYGDDVTCLYYNDGDEDDSKKASYYEKSSDMFLELALYETEGGKAIEGTQVLSDYREVK